MTRTLKGIFPFLFVPAVLSLAPALEVQPSAAEPAQDVRFTSSKDGTQQPALFDVPKRAAAGEAGAKVPLLVFLHSWSNDYKSPAGMTEALDESRRRGWVLIAPNFRGVNDHPDACASDLAVQDVLDSVEYARKQARVDDKRIYLLGSSGGGYMALMMATRAPQLWAAISAWVPITDLAAWYEFSKSTNSQYFKMMERCFGGPPETAEIAKEYRRRSPLFFLSQARQVRIYIDAGINDGHAGNAVPIRHSLLAFNVLAEANGLADRALSAEDVESMTKEARVPSHLAGEKEEDPARGQKILFRRTAGPVRLTIFDGGHSVDVRTGIRYFE